MTHNHPNLMLFSRRHFFHSVLQHEVHELVKTTQHASDLPVRVELN